MSQEQYIMFPVPLLRTLYDVQAPAINPGDKYDYAHVAAAANQHLARQLISIFSPGSVRMDELQASDRRLDAVEHAVWYEGNAVDPPRSWGLLRELNDKVVDQANQLQKLNSELNDARKELKELGQEVKQLRLARATQSNQAVAAQPVTQEQDMRV